LHVSPDRGDRGRGEGADLQETGGFQVPDGGRDVPPGGLWHQERPDDDLERGIRGPPALRAILFEETSEDLDFSVHPESLDDREGDEPCRVPRLYPTRVHPEP